MEIATDRIPYIREETLGKGLDVLPAAHDAGIGQAVYDAHAVSPSFHEVRLLHHLEVARGVGHARSNLPRQRLDISLPLAQDIHNLKAFGGGEGVGNPAKVLEDRVLELATIHEVRHIKVIN
jgi:hypothetical protein